MKRFIFVLIGAITLAGCKFINNPEAPGNNVPLSATAVMDSVQYTFAVPQSDFSVNDTLDATLTAYNQSYQTDTLETGYSPNFYTWTLTNDSSGVTIMYGPEGADNVVQLVPVAPNQLSVIYSIHQAIADTSGSAVKTGKYTLRWNLNDGTTNLMWFELKVNLK